MIKFILNNNSQRKTLPQKTSNMEPEVKCSICLRDETSQDDADPLTYISKCLHEFHESCINEWIKIKRSCPICRMNIKCIFYKKDDTPTDNILIKIDNYNRLVDIIYENINGPWIFNEILPDDLLYLINYPDTLEKAAIDAWKKYINTFPIVRFST